MVHREKKILRQKMRQHKENISFVEKNRLSGIIFKKIENHAVFQNAKIILLYWSMDDEVSTHEFINKWYQKKMILLPVTLDDRLELREFSGEEYLKKTSKLALYEPAGRIYTNVEAIDLVIVPGVAFDTNNNRLGRGKGYYDRLLPSLRAYKLGVCFDFQLLENIPHHEDDVKMDEVICN